ncbi:uroporphyrinogen-III synthase [Flagellimonas allohymeniacidonis]|uniref:Uroporphyrinogen-III synthase n=1 Tax=Flagellimonas allohymeniacidonis TaxID=2517819 RepID=A0A4Q8QAU1_9FLAO|nr:uroporphyrinogen-III synthase [Allomuricauda hymeniacidonis]TAI47435.1 uroporphyrinogen-III synthase [Allomuricauda hymeniacidonis]
MKTVLSTKTLTLPQKELLLNAGVAFVEYNAIQIDFLPVKIPLDFTDFIFTSKNGVKAFLRALESKNENLDRKRINCFCVGDKTKWLLVESGLTVLETALNALELAQIIADNYKTNRFIYISGNLRRNELPEQLSKNNVWFQEITAYQTSLIKKQFDRSFDGILFFSPSGVRSFMKANNAVKTPFFCIGTTTADEAKKYTNNIIIANRPTTENVLVQAIKYLNQND